MVNVIFKMDMLTLNLGNLRDDKYRTLYRYYNIPENSFDTFYRIIKDYVDEELTIEEERQIYDFNIPELNDILFSKLTEEELEGYEEDETVYGYQINEGVTNTNVISIRSLFRRDFWIEDVSVETPTEDELEIVKKYFNLGSDKIDRFYEIEWGT